MTQIIAVLATAFAFSFLFNCILFVKLKKPQKKPESLELREFLADLLSGPAMVAIARINPEDVLMRSPKNR